MTISKYVSFLLVCGPILTSVRMLNFGYHFIVKVKQTTPKTHLNAIPKFKKTICG